MRDPEEIEEQRAAATDAAGTTQWPGMTYEQGVEAALSWVLGDVDQKPMEDD